MQLACLKTQHCDHWTIPASCEWTGKWLGYINFTKQQSRTFLYFSAAHFQFFRFFSDSKMREKGKIKRLARLHSISHKTDKLKWADFTTLHHGSISIELTLSHETSAYKSAHKDNTIPLDLSHSKIAVIESTFRPSDPSPCKLGSCNNPASLPHYDLWLASSANGD